MNNLSKISATRLTEQDINNFLDGINDPILRGFLERLRKYILETPQSNPSNILELGNILSLWNSSIVGEETVIQQESKHQETLSSETSRAISTLVKHSFPSGESLNSLCKRLLNASTPSRPSKYFASSPGIHSLTLTALTEALYNDDPPHIRYPGDKDSYLQVQTSSAGMAGVRAFSVCIWARLDPDSSPKGFLLFRCLGQKGGIDAVLSDRQPQGMPYSLIPPLIAMNSFQPFHSSHYCS
jgi:hypothetical protein